MSPESGCEFGRTLPLASCPDADKAVSLRQLPLWRRPRYNAFSQLFADDYDVIHDNSVERKIDSDDAEYVIRRICEDFITGSSCTVVLCGAQTPQRKFVDWEKATLDKESGLIAVQLPTNLQFIVPARLLDNTQSGYAIWTNWASLTTNPQSLAAVIEQANNKDKALKLPVKLEE